MNYTIAGIDFGTSTTVVKVKNYGEGTNPKDCLPLTFNGNTYLPSLIFEDKNGQLYFGYDAEEQVRSSSEGVLYQNFKMDLIGDSVQQANAKRLITEFFKYIYSEFIQSRQRLNIHPTVKTYVSYPAKWTGETRSLMKQCAIDAGFGTANNVFGETEPTAAIFAAIAANLEQLQNTHVIIRNRPVNVMMLDSGAGTSDIVIFKFKLDANNTPVVGEKGQLITFPTVDSVYLCGGREIDELLAYYLTEYVKKASKNNQVDDGIIKAINDCVKNWKEKTLSPELKNRKTVGLHGSLSPIINMLKQHGILNDIPFDNIDRRQFELLTQSHWKQLRSLIVDSIKAATNKLHNFNGAEDIDLVILTGGHSQWYGVADFISGKSFAGLEPVNFSKIKQQPQRLLQEKHPQETVANGLAFKDIPFDVKYTMGNSLWVRYTVEGRESDVIPIARHNDVLPINQSLNFEYEVSGTVFRTKAISVQCEFLYGSKIETAKHVFTSKNIEIPNAVVNIVIASILGPIVTPIKFMKDWWNDGFDSALEDAKTPYEMTYNVNINSNVHINEDESIIISGNMNINNSEDVPYTINLD